MAMNNVGLEEVGRDLNEFGIDRGARDYFAQTDSAIARSDWERSRQELESILPRLMAIYNKGSGSAIKQASADATSNFDRGLQAAKHSMDRHGVNLTPDQQAAYDRQAKLQRGVADVTAQNMASRANDDLRQSIAAGM